MRSRLEASRSGRHLKRAAGGLVDVEFAVQLLQLKHGGRVPGLRTPNLWEALDAARSAGLLTDDEFATLRGGYDFWRQVECRLRIVTNRALNELPESPADLEKLARRLVYESAGQFLAERDRHAGRVRELFLRLLERER